MSYMLPHLHNGWQVDQAILSEEDRVIVSFPIKFCLWKACLNVRHISIFSLYSKVIRFGHDWDPACMKMDEVLYSIAEKVKNFAVFYLVDITEVSDFNKM